MKAVEPKPPSPAGPRFYERVVRGGFWLVAGRVVQQLLLMIRVVVLGYFLAPRHLGLLGMALLTTSLLSLFTETGFQNALVQKKNDIRAYLGTAWTIGLLRNVGLFLLLFLGAPYVVGFFDISPRFQPEQLVEARGLGQRLQQAADPAAAFTMEHLTPTTRDLLTTHAGPDEPPTRLRDALAQDLNLLLERERLWQTPAFAQACNQPHLAAQLALRRARGETLHANRLILETAFDGQIKPVVLDRATAVQVLRAVAATFLLAGITNLAPVYFQRELWFRGQFLWEFSGTVAGFLVSVVLVVWWRNVWALILGRLAAQAVQVATSYWLCPYRPRWRLHLDQARELWRFGRWIFLATVVGYLLAQGDNLFVGKWLGITALGLYQMAYSIAMTPVSEVTTVISRVTFPALSQFQDDRGRLAKGYLKALQFITFFSFPLAGLILVLGPDFVRLFLRSDYLAMVDTLRLLAVAGLASSIGASTGSLFQSAGRPDLITKLCVGKLVLLAALIYPCTLRWNITGTALAVMLSTVLVQLPTLGFISRVLDRRLREVVRPLGYALAATAAMTGLVVALQREMGAAISFVKFAGLITIAVVAYAVCACILDRRFGYGIGAILKEQVAVLLGRAGAKA